MHTLFENGQRVQKQHTANDIWIYVNDVERCLMDEDIALCRSTVVDRWLFVWMLWAAM